MEAKCHRRILCVLASGLGQSPYRVQRNTASSTDSEPGPLDRHGGNISGAALNIIGSDVTLIHAGPGRILVVPSGPESVNIKQPGP